MVGLLHRETASHSMLQKGSQPRQGGSQSRLRALPVSARRATALPCKVSTVEAPVAQEVVAAPAPVKEAPAAVTQEAKAQPATQETKAPQPESPPQPESQGYGSAVMLQGFGWDSCKKENWYSVLAASVEEVKALGVTHFWLPPPSQSVSAEGYMPGQLYNLESKYGNKEQLIELVKSIKAAGMKPLADIVINHRCADEKIDGVYAKFRDDVDHEGVSIDWGKWAITGNDTKFQGQGNPDTGDDYEPAPDLDHANPDLRRALKEWLSWLQTDVGYEGWRLDYVKGYGAEFVKEYIDATVTGANLNVGELWTDMEWNGSDLSYNQDAARQRLCDWIDGAQRTCTAFDFPTKGILQEAIKNTQYGRLKDGAGKAPGLIGWWPQRAVTFIDNHDTGSTQQHWPFPSDSVGAGYAYILTHPGIPCIFWEHAFDWGEEMKNTLKGLVALRQRTGISSASKLDILCAEDDLYVARIDDKVTVKLGPRFSLDGLLPAEAEGWKMVSSGHNFAVWEKSSA